MSKQTERQYGAFIALYAAAFKRAYVVDKKSKDHEFVANLRNDVVHKGTIPTASDAERDGDIVYRRIRKLDDELALFNEAYLEFVWRRTRETQSKQAKRVGSPATRIYVPMILCRTEGEDTFKGQLADLRQRLAMLLRDPLVAL